MQTEKDIRDKIFKQIQRIKINMGAVSSVSISLNDYDILRQYDPSCFYCSKPNSWMPDTYRGMKMNLTKKVTRVNAKWSEQSKYSSRIKRKYKNSCRKIMVPYFTNQFLSYPMNEKVSLSPNGDQITIDYTFQVKKPLDYIKV